jgi:hypothetical protein
MESPLVDMATFSETGLEKIFRCQSPPKNTVSCWGKVGASLSMKLVEVGGLLDAFLSVGLFRFPTGGRLPCESLLGPLAHLGSYRNFPTVRKEHAP